MKTTTALSLTVLLVAPLGTASLAACASDPNKQLKEAAAQEAEANRVQHEAQIDIARLEESRQKLQLGGGDVPTSIQDKLRQTARLTEGLSNQIAHVAQVGDDRWSSEKKRIEEQLEDLEKSANDVKSDADRYPR
jgi:hypothetical protein